MTSFKYVSCSAKNNLINKFTVVISLCLVNYSWVHEIEDEPILLCVWHVLQNWKK
jgi:hypothetical protein